MRIIAGTWRGRRLATPEGAAVRPTSDRVREALFGILAHAPAWRRPEGPLPVDAVVLDAFAGTGAAGIEALSRGARAAIFLEQDRKAAALIRRNLTQLGAEQRGEVLERDATRPGRASRAADLILLDPPYRSGLAAPALEALAEGGWLAPDAVAIVETEDREAFAAPSGFETVDSRRYGRAALHFLRRTETA
jgi:16S rRNA (guanine966-N2)-methyltransferase